MRHQGNTRGMRRGAASWIAGLAAAIGSIVSLDSPAGAQPMPCVGDCDGNRVVAINELIRGVSIALTQQPASSCTAFDSDLSDTVTINELVQGVGAALRGCFPPVAFRGLCRIPSVSGLVPCAAGSAVRLSLCLDRTRCLFDPTARRLLSSGTLGAEGRFFLSVEDEDVLNALLLLESDVANGITYRALGFGPAAAGASIADFDVDPIREAMARLFNSNGLNLFSDLSISEIIAIIANALAALDFAGLSPEAAVQLAENSANQNPAVQDALNSRRFTPTPTHTATSTSTQVLTATSTATPTIVLTATVTLTRTATLTPTVTLTPTSTLTASQTASQTATFTASLSPSASPTLTPTASTTATPSSTPTPTITNSPTATLPPLNLALEVNPDPVRPGETIEASLIVSNTGGSSIGPISLEMVLPMAIDPFLDNLASANGRCGPNQIQMCNPGATVTWPFIGNIEPGQAIAVRVPPIVAAGTANGTMLTFSATAGAPGLSAMRTYSAVVQTGTGPAPFDLALHADREPVLPGTTLGYTVVYGFRAVAGQADTVLRVRPPQGTTFVNASDGGDLLPSGEIEWQIGTLTPGDGGIRRFTVALDDDLPGTILDAQGVIERDDGSGDKRANAVTWAQAAQPVGLEIETNPDPAQPGENIETAITITNPGAVAQTVTLDLVAPDQVETIIDGNVTGGGVCGPFTLGNPCERRSRIRWTLTVPPHDGLTVRADPLVSAGAINGSLINFQARLANLQGSYVTSARSAVRVDGGTIWDLYLDDERDPVGLADTFTYRLTLRHRPSDANPVDGVLTLRLPPEVTLVDADDGIAEDGTIEWALGTLAANAVVSRSAVVQVANGATAGSVLSAEAEIRAADDALAAKRVRTLTRIAQSLPLGLSAMLHPDPVRPGEVLQTELTVSNSGSGNLNGVRVELRIPTGTDAFAQSLSAGASCSAVTLQCAPGTVGRWQTGTVAAGDSASIQLPPRVSAGTADGTLLRLHAYATDLGQTSKDAVLSRTVVVDGTAPFDLSINESDDPVTPGQMLDYTLHFGRRGPGAASAARLFLQLPPNVFFVSSPDGGTNVDEIVQWELGDLAEGENGSRVVTVVVDAIPPGSPLHARATILDDDLPSTAKRADVVTVAGIHPVTFTLSAAPDPVTPGGTATVSLSITNNGASTLSNLILEGFVPPESNGFLDTATTGMGLCGPFSANQCEPRARVLWPIPTLTGGQTIVVTMPPPIRADVEPGSVVRFLGRLQLVQGNTPALFASDAVTVTAAP